MQVNPPEAGVATPAPIAEPKQSPANAPKKPQDNTAAKQYPKETETAVANSYGKVPQNGNNQQPENAPKTGDGKQPDDTKAPAKADSQTSPPKTNITMPDGTPGVKTPSDGSTPGSDYVGEQAKDAQGTPLKTPDGLDVHYDTKNRLVAVKDGFPVVDPKGNQYAIAPDGKFMQPEAGKYAVYDRNNGKLYASDPETGARNADAMGHPYALDKNGQYMQPEPGVFAVYDNVGALGASDPATGAIKADPNGNAYALSADGKFMQPEQGKYAAYEKNTGFMVAVDAKGNIAGQGNQSDSMLGAFALDTNGQYLKTPDGLSVGYDMVNGGKLVAWAPNVGALPVKDGNGNPYAIKPDGTYATTASGESVVYDQANGGAAVAIDPKTGQAIRDTSGHILALGGDGNFLKTPEGHTVVYNQDNGNKLAAISPSTGAIAQDGSGNPYLIQPDGKYAVTKDGSYVVYDKAYGNKPVAINPQTGVSVKGPFGNPLVIGEDGEFVKTETGMQVVYETVSGKLNPVATDGHGEILVLEGNPIAVDKYGKQLFTPGGLAVVYDKRGNQVALGQDNKIVTDGKGNALALGKNAQFLPSVVYDKGTGFKVMASWSGNYSEGAPIAIDENGKAVLENGGGHYDSRGKIVFETGTKTPGGLAVFKNAESGQLQTADLFGIIYKVDPTTNDLAKDADGKLLPPLYNPVDSDPTRPPVQPNEDPATTHKNIPKGTQTTGLNKSQLNDEFGNLSKEKLYEVMSQYDPKHVYEVIAQSNAYARWNDLGSALPDFVDEVPPDSGRSAEILAAISAWQNANGKYRPLKADNIPPVVLFANKPHVSVAFNKAKLDPPVPGHPIYIDLNASGGILPNLFNGITSSQVSPAFHSIYGSGTHKAAFDIVTEYIASDWTGEKMDSITEANYKPGFEQIEKAVLQLGNGDRNTGIERLKRAYFAGDMAAIEELKQYFAPSSSDKDYKTPGL